MKENELNNLTNKMNCNGELDENLKKQTSYTVRLENSDQITHIIGNQNTLVVGQDSEKICEILQNLGLKMIILFV
jgi:hypothetical protein